MKNKKGVWEWEQLGKLLIALLILIICFILIIVFKDKIIEIFGKLKEVIRFA